MTKRLIAILLVLATMLSLMGSAAPAVIGEGAVSDAAVEEVIAAAVADEAASDYSADIGKHAEFSADLVATDWIEVLDTEPAEAWSSMLYNRYEFSDDIRFEVIGRKVVAEYYDVTDEETGEVTGQSAMYSLWYCVNVVAGTAVPEGFLDGYWILQNYLDEDAYEVDTLRLFAVCPVCKEEVGTTDDHKCDICGEYDCTTEHVQCPICGAAGCTVTHVYCSVCGKYDCGVDHNVSNPPLTAPVIPDFTLDENTESAVVDGNGVAASAYTLEAGKQMSLSAWTHLDNASYKWQIRYGKDAEGNDLWTDIHGKTGKGILFSAAMLLSAVDSSNTAYLRFVATEGTEVITSDPAAVTVNTATASSGSSDPAAVAVDMAEGDTSDETTLYTVTIEYVYAAGSKFAGQRVAVPYIAEVPANGKLTDTVTSPECVGYSTDTVAIDLSTFGEITGNESRTVYYSPALVSYTVRHYQQNVDDDEYTWVDTTMATGYTEELTSDNAAKTYTGFTALSHYHEEIAADSSTVIDIYYDRNYYLMSFDLDGGYGVEPIYARYGAEVSVGTPYKPGYDFAAWDGTIPTTMPAENKTFKASWNAKSGIPFTVAYWLEDANTEGKYNYWGATPQTAVAGSTVQGETYKDYSAIAGSLDTYEMRYSYYDHADTNVVIKGDGSTVVNVYYKRNEYTLKFYYAARTGSEGAYTYKIFGGSTYDFGQDQSNTTINGDELLLLNNMYKNKSAQWGQVTSEPTLNTIGASRVSNNTYVKDIDSYNNVDYLYISFTAKYGEDISGAWPCNVFDAATRTTVSDNTNQWTGTAAYVSAWNGEHHVYYSQHNTNETIKGNYNELDYQLLFDNCGTHNYTDSETVAYLCFWENGSGNVNWNTPRLFRYNIYVQVLTGQESNQTDDGKYYLWATYDTCDNSIVGEQTAPAINGYTLVKGPVEGDALTDYDTTKYASAANVNFFYTRDRYLLSFKNGSKTEQASEVYFGADISGMEPSVTYFDSNLADMYVFGGWYTSPEALPGSEFNLTDATMPSSALTLYAKWNLITHDVSIYKTEDGVGNADQQIGTTIAVTHGELVPDASRPDTSTLAHPTDESATFIGWFYKDGNGEEQAFDFATMTITADMTIYAKWRSNVMKQVEIYYVVENDDGTTTQVADTETLMLRLGQTRTFEAKTGNSLYSGFRTNYFPTTSSHSITITDSDIQSNSAVAYSFVYKYYEKVPYQVEFYVQEADGSERPAFKEDANGKAVFVEYGTWSSDYKGYVEQHWDNNKAVVTELYVPDNLAVSTWVLPDAYLPNALKIQKIIVPSGTDPETNIAANTIKFVYTYTEKVVDPDNPGTPVYQARYLVQHFIQNVPNTSVYDLYSWTDETGLSGKTVTASPISIPGYSYSYEVTNTNMGIYNTSRDPDNVLTQNPDAMSGTISAKDDLELNFYYTANSYPYRVMYLEEGTNRVLATTKTTGADGKQLTGLYGAEVTETAIDLNGDAVDEYEIVGSSTKSIYIQMEAGNTASVNTIVFYYKLKSADLIISKTVALDAEQAKEAGIDTLPESALTQAFTFTINCPTGYNKSVYDYTLTTVTKRTNEDGTETVTTTSETGKITTPDGYNMTVSLKHNQSIQIHGLIMGSYVITETYVPGFRITVNGNTDAQQKENVSITATLVEANQNVQVDFTNSYPFYTGELVLGKTVTKADSRDPSATEPYKVNVVLRPAAEAREVDRVITWTNADGEPKSLAIPALTGTNDKTEFTAEVLVPVAGTVTLSGVPAGNFTATETAKGTVGYISDSYAVKTYSKLHNNEETITADGESVNGVVHGGHATTVTFNNKYKKGDLIINKTVTQEYENDNWTSDTFTFTISGTTELPDGTYYITVGGEEKMVVVTNGKLSISDDITVSKETHAVAGKNNEWLNSLTIGNLPAGYYTVVESSSTGGLGQYTVSGPESSLLVNDTANDTVFAFTNTYKRTMGDLTIKKSGSNSIDANQSFIFDIKDSGGNLVTTVVIHGNNSATVKDLLAGAYTVTEQTDWSWRYSPVDNGKTVTVTSGGTGAVEFQNKRNIIYWLSGDSFNENQFTVKTATQNQ